MNAVASVETLVRLQLRNRFVWLALGLALYLIGQLSYWQLKFDRFDTLTLMSHLMVVFEVGLLAVALIVALSEPKLRSAWYAGRTGAQPYPHFLAVVAGALTLVVCATILLAPLLVLHRYPELVSQGIGVPLMVLQRGMLLLLTVLVTLNLLAVLRLYLRWTAWISALLAVAWHVGFGYWVTHLSSTVEFFRPLNDVFYYNQLWPELQREQVFHNIQQPFFAFFGTAALLWLLTLILLAPGALTRTRRERPPAA